MRGPITSGLLLLVAVAAGAQQPSGDAKSQVRAFNPAPLRFQPPAPKRVTLSNGVPVYLLRDASLPVLNVQIASQAGVAHLPDSLWGVGWQADGLLRTGGTTRLTPDSVDKLVEFYALNIGFATDNESSSGFVAGLARYNDVMLELAFDMMRNPRNDSSRVRITQAQQQEGWRRRNDQPQSVLGRAWNQVMLGDHPLGRSIVTPPEIAGFTRERFRWVQERIFCPQNLLLGVSGDFDERALLRKLESLFRGWPACKPGLRDMPPLRFAAGPQVVLVEKDINQTNIRMGHGGGIRVADTPDYFAAQVADFLLGGSGFTSRLLQRVRSDSGFAYSTFSVWEADTKREGMFFAGAQIRAEKTVAGVKLMRDVVASMERDPVTAEDVRLAQDNTVNSFVVQFETAGQIVGQQLQYAVDSLPANWFDVYLRGVQAVTPPQVTAVAQHFIKPDRLVTVVVGKSATFDRPLAELGTVTLLPVDSIRR
ncbi:MAG: M16 family metallopeptidase [Gemmatimonadales bacterium]